MVFQIVTDIPDIEAAPRKNLDKNVVNFLKKSGLRLGAKDSFLRERNQHTKVLANVRLSNEQKSVKVIPHIVNCPSTSDINVRQYVPKNASYEDKKLPVLVYIHGGGWTVGSLPEFDSWFRTSAYHGEFQVISPEYHLAPEWRYPAQLEEIISTLQWIKDNSDTLGIDKDKIALGGDSCGGNMTGVLCQKAVKEPFGVVPQFQVLFYPEMKLPFEVPSGAENYDTPYLRTQSVFLFAWNMVPEGKKHTDYDITPLNGDIPENLPPAFIVTCGYDPLRDTGLYYAQKLQKHGVKVEWLHNEDLTHGFLQFTNFSNRCKETTAQCISHIKTKFEQL